MRKALWIIGILFVLTAAPKVQADTVVYTYAFYPTVTAVVEPLFTYVTITPVSFGQVVTALTNETPFELGGQIYDVDSFTFLANTPNFNELSIGTDIDAPIPLLYATSASDFTPIVGVWPAGIDHVVTVSDVSGNEYGYVEVTTAACIGPGGDPPLACSAVPEINPSDGRSALALIAGALLVIRGRRKKMLPEI